MKLIFSCLCTLVICTCMHVVHAEETKATPSLADLGCSKEELTSFFPYSVVQSILLQANFSQDKADHIAQALSKQDSEIIKKVEEKASKLEPNPFKDLSQRDIAIKIYQETLYEEFSKTLNIYGITDKDEIQHLLEQMKKTRSRLFIECIHKQTISS
jgi:hypothetical protein